MGGSLGSFLVRRVLETDCVAILEEESSEVNINVGIAMSKKENRRNEGGGRHIPSSKTEGVASSASVAVTHQIRVFVRDRAKKTQSRVGFRPLNRPTEQTRALCILAQHESALQPWSRLRTRALGSA